MNRFRFFVVVVASLVLVTFAHAQNQQTVSADDTARFLAGMQPSANSPLAPLTQEPAAKQHTAAFDAAFGNIEKNQLSKIRAWASANLTAPRPVMFYMFGGPDFIYADAFFPKATTYVLSGLEPVGQIPDLTKLPRGSVLQGLRNIEGSLRSILNYSFFQTAHMHYDLNAGPVNGTLPILYVFLARSGKVIHDVSLVQLDDQGVLHVNDGIQPPSSARGVKIIFSENNGPRKTLYYFSANVSDIRGKNNALLHFAKPLGPGDSFIKSASYLLHTGGFTQVRNFLLENSSLMLQDDTGVPFALFDPAKWHFRTYGRYLGPAFGGYSQPKLTELFQTNPPNPIEFGLGYRWRSNGSNLLLATRNPNVPDVTASVPKEEPARKAADDTAPVTRPTAAYPVPIYMDPNGPVHRCWVTTDRDRGFGYFRQPC